MVLAADRGPSRWKAKVERLSIAGQSRRTQLALIGLGWLVTRAWMARALGWFSSTHQHASPTAVYQDVLVYHSWALEILKTHQLPTGVGWQYPVGAAVLFLLPHLDAMHYNVVFCLVMFACDLCTTAVLGVLAWHERRFRGVWVWLVLVFVFGPMTVLRFDLAPTLAVVVALAVMWTGNRTRWFGALISAGALLKVWPVLALVACNTRRGLVRAVAWCVAMVIVATGVASLFWGNTLGFISHQSGRGLEIESVAASPWFMREAITHAKFTIVYGSGTLEISSQIANDIASLLRVVMVLAGVVLGYWWLMQTRGGRTLTLATARDAVFVVVLWYLVISPILSPQYLIWLIGVMAVLCCSRETLMRRPMMYVAVSVLLTRAVYERSNEFETLATRIAPSAAVSGGLVLRNLVLLVAAVDALWILVSPSASQLTFRRRSRVGATTTPVSDQLR